MGWLGKAPGKVPFELKLKEAKKKSAMITAKGCLFHREHCPKKWGRKSLEYSRTRKGTDRAEPLGGRQFGTRREWPDGQEQIM